MSARKGAFGMTQLVLGTANLFGATDAAASHAVLREAVRLGYDRLDTAPSYGHGDSEPAVGALAREYPGIVVGTKVGIEPVPAPGRGLRLVKAAARRLPGAVQDRVRGATPPGHGHFAPADVDRSVQRSLDRLPRIDRLLLHEPHPDDLTPELLAVLSGYLDDGRIGALGVAGSNELAAACLARAPGLFDVVHLAVGPGAVLPELPASVRRVGHGALGPDAAGLRRLTQQLTDAAWRRRWQLALEGSGLAPDVAPARVLIGRAALRVDELIVATSRPERLPGLQDAVASPVPVDLALQALITQACG